MTVPHALSSYIPRILRREIASRGFGWAPTIRRTRAVIVIADIRDFCAIIEGVAPGGGEALESLSANLSELFSDFIDDIYSFGGDVLYMAGDAFVCFWPETRVCTLEHAADLAISAALSAQEHLAGRDTGFGDDWLMRVGIGSGALYHAFVGGTSNRWELIISGSAFEQAAAAERSAKPGRVNVSMQTWELCQHQFVGTPGEHDVEIISRNSTKPFFIAEDRPEPPVSDHQLEAYLPASVVHRHLPMAQSWLSEFRQVTVMIVTLPTPGIEIRGELPRAHNSVAAFQSIIGKYEGSFKVQIDDKGVVLLAFFGLPHLAHEDNATRAIHAAWAIQREWENQNFEFQAGITSGRALCAPLGNDSRRDYMVVGDVVNRASRLLYATPNIISCDETTRDLAQGAIVFEDLPDYVLRGMLNAVPAFRPTGVRHDVMGDNRPLIGRHDLLQRFEQLLGELLTGQSVPAVMIEAEAGLGKSSLIDEFQNRAIRRDLRVLRARGDAIERSSPYHPWRRLFSEILGLVETVDMIGQRRRFSDFAATHPVVGNYAPILAGVVGLRIEDNETTRNIHGDARAELVQEILIGVLREFARDEPFVLFVDDAHWFDSRSWELLADFANSDLHVLLVAATRPVREHYQDWTAISSLERTQLPEFQRTETVQLLSRRTGAIDIPNELLLAVVDRAGGNPLFCEQTVQAIIESGGVKIEQGECKVGELVDFPIAQNVEGMIQTRLDLLDITDLLILKAASIIGMYFSAELVADMVHEGIARSVVGQHLSNLATAGFIEKVAGHNPHTHRFRHYLTRQVTYRSLTNSLRTAGHEIVARWLEAKGEVAQSNFSLLAHHWRGAGNQERALEYLEGAGDSALRNGSYQEALALYRQAQKLGKELGIGTRSSRAALWSKGLGTAYYFVGSMEESRAHIENTVAILDRSVPASQAGVVLGVLNNVRQHVMARLRKQRYEWDGRVDKRVHDLLVDCYKMLGQLYFLEGKGSLLLIYTTLRGLNVAENSGPSNSLACVLINMSLLARLAGLERASGWYAETAQAMAANDEHNAALPNVWHIDALRDAQHAKWENALASNRRAMTLMNELGDRTLAPECAAVRSAIAMCMGDIDNGARYARDASVLAEARSNTQYLCWATLDEVEIALARGDLASAKRMLERAMKIPTEEGDFTSTLDKQRAIAITHLRDHRYNDAITAADKIFEILRHEAPTSYFVLDFYASAIEACIVANEKLGTECSLDGKISKNLVTLKKYSRTFWNVKSRYWLLKAMHELAGGKDPGASLKRAIVIAQSLDLAFDEARALLVAAKADLGHRFDLEPAAKTFKQLGHRYYSEQLDACRKRPVG